MPETPDQPGQISLRDDLTGTTVGRFAVRWRLGAGGMGEVYRADDTTLKRPVALKRLAPQLRADPRFRERFFREAERASSLSHQHIASIYDVFEDHGEPFLVMEFVEGVTLRERLKESLPLKDFLKIAFESAEALAAAHQKRLVHRDIKPENIMLTRSGDVKILDFGVARRLPHTDPQAVTDSDAGTMEGGLTGTFAYMAPEVLLNKEADGRADIFSLGIVAYEVLAGRHPFKGDNLITTSDRILHEVPPPPSRLNPSVPVELDQLVGRMLAKDPSARYNNAEELVADLKSFISAGVVRPWRAGPRVWKGKGWALAATAALLLLLAIGVAPQIRQRLFHRPGTAAVSGEKSVVVLPFRAIGGGPEEQVYCDGMTETLTAKLTQLTVAHELAVAPASEVRALKVSSAEAARKDLGATLVLAGTLFRSGGKVRVNYELVDARTLRQLRADTITVGASDPFAVQDRVAEGAVEMLDLALGPAEQRAMVTHGTEVAGAYDLYLQGRSYLQNFDKLESVDNAITTFNRALKLDPQYALASAGLGEAFWDKYETTKEPPWATRARDACNQAVALDSEAAEARICLGTLSNGTGQFEKAVDEFQHALEDEPTRDDAYRGLASAYENLNKLEDAEKTYQRAIHLRPRYWAGYNALGVFYARQARYAQAAEMFQQVVRLVPDSFRGYSNLGGTYILQGRYADAIPMFERAVSIRPMDDAYSNLGTAYFYLRRFADSARSYKDALKLNDQSYIIWGNLGDAYYYGPGGNKGEAAGAYEKAIALALQDLRVNPRDSAALGYLAYYLAMKGQREPALGYLNRALVMAPSDPELLFNGALVYNQLGEADRALEWLKKALKAGYSPNVIRETPILDHLRTNPGFDGIFQKK
jgi:eukaryotic-like serine/threonine-protein kinase